MAEPKGIRWQLGPETDTPGPPPGPIVSVEDFYVQAEGLREAKRIAMDRLRSACQDRIDSRGPDAVISCAYVLEQLGENP